MSIVRNFVERVARIETAFDPELVDPDNLAEDLDSAIAYAQQDHLRRCLGLWPLEPTTRRNLGVIARASWDNREGEEIKGLDPVDYRRNTVAAVVRAMILR
jgi:hypothetical protein